MATLLSIITINRNNITGLKKTVESVVTQICNDFEYIIIDGASTDSSVDVIKNYKSHSIYGNKITYWISEPDTGIYNAMNKGIKHATGTYVYILNSGDWLEHGALQTIIQVLKNKSPDVLLLCMNMWKNNKKINSLINYPAYLPEGTLYHQGMIYKKKLHSEYGLYDEAYKYAADFDFILKALYNKNFNYAYIYTPFVNFPTGGLGESKTAISETTAILTKYGFLKSETMRHIIKNKLKYCIKLFLPFGILELMHILKYSFDRKKKC